MSTTPGQLLARLSRRAAKLQAEAEALRKRIKPLERRLRVVEAEGAEVQTRMQNAQRLLRQLEELCGGTLAKATGNGRPTVVPIAGETDLSARAVLAALRDARAWVGCARLAELMGAPDQSETVSVRLSYLMNVGDVVRRPRPGGAAGTYEYAHPDLLTPTARGAVAAAAGGRE